MLRVGRSWFLALLLPTRPAALAEARGRLLSRLLRRSPVSVPSATQELEMLESSFNSDPEGLRALFREKLEVWRELREEGQLQRLSSEELDETVLEEVDRAAEAKGLRIRLEGAGRVVLGASPSREISDRERAVAALRTKLAGMGGRTRASAVAVYALFNEIKDKGALDAPLVEACLGLLARSGAGRLALAAFEQYAAWLAEGAMAGRDPSFPLRFLFSCASSGLAEAVGPTSRRVLELGWVSEGDLRAVELSSAILSARHPTEVDRVVAELSSDLTRMSVEGANLCVRALGRARRCDRLFAFVDSMRAAGLTPNEETLEFLANAFIVSVREKSRARAMRELPAANASVPEVVFVGRSNVGKSSLVNFLVNRKALAPTSATPGHTRSFNFYAVNEGRSDLPHFLLVDVPGLGFAEADEGTQDSWRSLLERYASVRDSLVTVFHLVDSRHGLTAVDRQLIEMLVRATGSRGASGRSSFRYVTVLTKADKASAKQIADTRKNVIEDTRSLVGGDLVHVLQSSSFDGRGREDLLRTIVEDVMSVRKRTLE